jgi:acyl-CoA thioesterase-1
MRSFICVLLLLCASWLCVAQTAPNKILIVGDSLSTAYGIDRNEGWVSLLAHRLASQAPDYIIVNESISGQTTAVGLAELPNWLSTHKPQILILELGGNDGLQGLPLAHMHDNLAQMITLAQKDKLKILLLGMQLPPNYGPQYTEGFKHIYPQLASEYKLPLVPFFLENVGGYLQYMQYDSIHPSLEAQKIMLDNVWPYLQPLLK